MLETDLSGMAAALFDRGAHDICPHTRPGMCKWPLSHILILQRLSCVPQLTTPVSSLQSRKWDLRGQ